MHKVIKPKILYFGAPVVLISTLNEDGSTNLAPISSAWWLGQSCMRIIVRTNIWLSTNYHFQYFKYSDNKLWLPQSKD